jgi:CheY-like chemotaxis protein
MNNRKALIIEDNLYSQELLIGCFFELDWQEPVIASTGPEAIQILKMRAHEFDVIILDNMLPPMTGFDVYENVKNISGIAPFIMVTGTTHNQNLEQRASEIGIRALLYKNNDLNSKALGEVIEMILGSVK